MLYIPASNGEIYDKITILRIKAEKFAAGPKLDNVLNELKLLEDIEKDIPNRETCQGLVDDLHRINAELWVIEDGKRAHERTQDFGPDFIALARSVYIKNDTRAAIKRQINEATLSEIFEEKSHAMANAAPVKSPSA